MYIDELNKKAPNWDSFTLKIQYQLNIVLKTYLRLITDQKILASKSYVRLKSDETRNNLTCGSVRSN